MLILGGGSNLLVGDDGFPGTVVKIATRGITEDVQACSGAVITVAAGEPWDPLVAYAVVGSGAGWRPCPASRAWSGDPDPERRRVRLRGQRADHPGPDPGPADRPRRTLVAADCGFRLSQLAVQGRRRGPAGIVILSVTFQLRLGSLSARSATRAGPGAGCRGRGAGARPPTYAPPCSRCAPARAWCWTTTIPTPGAPAPSSPTRSWTGCARPSCRRAPRFAQPDGRVKTSAAWLIEAAGFGKGYGTGPARLSDKHVLALTNRGDARAADLLALAREVRAGVRAEVRHRPGPGAGPGGDASCEERCWSRSPSGARSRVGDLDDQARRHRRLGRRHRGADGGTTRAGGDPAGRCPISPEWGSSTTATCSTGPTGPARPPVPAAAGRRARMVPDLRPRVVHLDRPPLDRPQLAGGVIYELHVGTFTPEGTLDGGHRPARPPGPAGRGLRRADAGQRLQRPPQLGLRRGALVRGARGVRRTGRLPAVRRRVPPASGWG